jgi:hypothetical protein
VNLFYPKHKIYKASKALIPMLNPLDRLGVESVSGRSISTVGLPSLLEEEPIEVEMVVMAMA